MRHNDSIIAEASPDSNLRHILSRTSQNTLTITSPSQSSPLPSSPSLLVASPYVGRIMVNLGNFGSSGFQCHKSQRNYGIPMASLISKYSAQQQRSVSASWIRLRELPWSYFLRQKLSWGVFLGWTEKRRHRLIYNGESSNSSFVVGHLMHMCVRCLLPKFSRFLTHILVIFVLFLIRFCK